jgi:Bifunctional DNA primase/polymerase, N-terminal/AAA domain
MSILSSVQVYINRNWKLVPLFGVDSAGRCECGKASCPKPGKHPRQAAWGSSASYDETTVKGWDAQWPHMNVGLLLGPASGIVDIESDGSDGGILLQKIVGEVATPSYSSGRGIHYLFSYDDTLRTYPSTVTVNGIEYRIGNAGQTQSVIPPSRHANGSSYAWLSGRSPADVDVAGLPAELRRLLESSRRTPPLVPNGTPAERWDKEAWGVGEFVMGDASGPRIEDDIRAAPGVVEGERNRTLTRLIGIDMARHNGPRDGLLQDALDWAARCNPPYSAKESTDVVRHFERAHANGTLSHDPTRTHHTLTATVPTLYQVGQSEDVEKPATIEPIPLAELQGDPNVDWVWKGFIAKGYATLLTGQWKAGKSTLMAHLLRALGGDGGDIGGTVSPRTPTFYLSEEAAGLWVRRRDELGIKGPIDVLTRSQVRRMNWFEWESFTNATAGWVAEKGYKLVMIDTLASYWPCDDENDAINTLRALEPLRAICNAGAGLLIVHHPRKGEGLNVTSSARGSGAILGWPDILVQFERCGGITDRKRILSGVGRFDETPAKIVIELSEDKQSFCTLPTTASQIRRYKGCYTFSKMLTAIR